MPEPSNRGGKALQSVNATKTCPGCDQAFTPCRRNQKHCRPGCRVRALQRRRETRQAALFEVEGGWWD